MKKVARNIRETARLLRENPLMVLMDGGEPMLIPSDMEADLLELIADIYDVGNRMASSCDDSDATDEWMTIRKSIEAIK